MSISSPGIESLPVSDGAMPRRAVNELTIRVGTVNGSGSQSANLVLLRALHAMGLPCGGKNIFPSNIEGLPTWFQIRASARGYIGQGDEVDVLVCMNPQTAEDDLMRLRPGSVCFVPEGSGLDHLRDDVLAFAVPFQTMAEAACAPGPGERPDREKVRKVVNMVYVGVVAEACGIEPAEVHAAIRKEFPGRKAKAAEVNIRAADAGYAWAEAHLPGALPFRVARLAEVQPKVLIDGNKAAALGAVFGGVSVLTWYPITPSSSLAEHAEVYLKKFRVDPDGRRNFAIVQAEDELAAVGMAIGAGWAGARSLTATAGPGISLMAEFVGLSYFAEVPVVIVDVQRMGPSTGLPTRTSQGDMVKLHLLGHGDCHHPVLIPGTVAECFAMTSGALDIAQEYQGPVFVATDLDLGMNLWPTEPFDYPSGPIRRGKVLDADDLERLGEFGRYRDVDGDGVCFRTLPGTEHPLAAYFTRGTGHDEQAGYSEKPEVWEKNLDRLARKMQTTRALLPRPLVESDPGATVGLIAYGSTHWAMIEARDRLRERGVATAYCRVRALPADDGVADFVAGLDRVYVVEQNRDAQFYRLLRSEWPGRLADRLVSVTHYDGTPISARDIAGPVLDREQEGGHAHGRP